MKNIGSNLVKPEHRLHVTKEELERFLPKGTRRKVTEKILELINSAEEAGIDQGYMREKVLSLMDVLKSGKYSIEDYINAIKFNALVLSGISNRKAYMIVFPDRTDRILKKYEKEEDRPDPNKIPEEYLDNYVNMYNQGELVIEIRSRMMLDASLLMYPVHMEALNVKINLMRGIAAPDPVTGKPQRVTPMVQLQAAQAVWEATKMPEDNTIKLKVGLDKESMESQKALADSIRQMAEVQAAALKAGKKLDEVQKINVEYIDAEVTDE